MLYGLLSRHSLFDFNQKVLDENLNLNLEYKEYII